MSADPAAFWRARSAVSEMGLLESSRRLTTTEDGLVRGYLMASGRA